MTGTAQAAVTEVVAAHHEYDLRRALRWSVKTFPAVPRTCGRSRLYVAGRLHEWGFGTPLTDKAVLVVSELVANAVRASAELQRPAVPPVHVALAMYERHLLLFVADASGKFPLRVDHNADSEGCRGLFLVNAMSDRWGWHPVTTWPGTVKCVWAEWRTKAR
jgi:anti-sigma regulatory factor (Ser/Thr protein kinase)